MSGLRVADFDFDLPPELIAQQPPQQRGQSRMLVMDRASGELQDSQFADFPALLHPDDLLVLNDSRVIPARLYARRTLRREREKPTGRIEVMLTEPAGDNLWRALVRPGRKVAIGERLVFLLPTARCARSRSPRARTVRRPAARSSPLSTISSPFSIALATCHCRPISIAMTRTLIASDTRPFSPERDRWRRPPPACTLPAGARQDLRRGARNRPRNAARGLGTFAPLRVDNVDDVKLHRERYTMPLRRRCHRIALAVKTLESSPSAPPWFVPLKRQPRAAGRTPQRSLRRDGYLHFSRIRISDRRRPAHQFSSASVEPPDAGQRICRAGTYIGSLPACDTRLAIVFQLWRLHVSGLICI